MSKPKILIQFDPDTQASTFDSVVALDSGVDQLLTRSLVTQSDVEGLIHGAIFTRGMNDLKSTALFFGGSDVTQTQALVEKAKASFFGPMRVSLMADPNGANTTAAAAVLSAMQHIDFSSKEITVLAGTGPVGIRITELIAGPATRGAPAKINVCSRKLSKAEKVCEQIRASIPKAQLVPVETATPEQAEMAVCNACAVFAAGAAGVQLLGEGWLDNKNLHVAVDVNGVLPTGIYGIEVMDKAVKRAGAICYGAIGVGGLKMKIHKRCIQMLFESNEHVLEVKEIFAIGQKI